VNGSERLELWYPQASDGVRAALEAHACKGWRVHFGEARPAQVHWLIHGRPTAAQLDEDPGLRGVVIPWSGLPVGTRELLLERRHLRVHNLHHNATAVAEMAIALLLAAIRRLPAADAALRRGDWTPRYAERSGTTLAGRRALILGGGAIGSRVARILGAMEVRVDVLRRRPRAEAPFPEHGPEALDALLPERSILINALPATPATSGLIDARRLARLPAGSAVVNVGRADVFDERALYEALHGGALGAAGLDVWYRYPASEAERTNTPPSEFPFGELPNVALSPHRAGHLADTEGERARHLVELFGALASGGAAPGRVDVEAGY
jgi:phosphoglycerate dehydrogenase-like enzyme